MATAVRVKSGIVEVKVPSADWGFASSPDKCPWGTNVPGPRIQSIEFIPGASVDECYINAGSASGPRVAFFRPERDGSNALMVGGAPLIKYFYGKRFQPFIDQSLGTYSAGSSIIITLE